MKNFILGLALSLSASASFAADLPRRAVPVAPAPVFVGLDAFASVAVGYNWGRLGSLGTDVDANGLELSARGTFFAPIAPNWGVQADGQYERSVNNIDLGGDLKKNTGELAGHVFWRDPNVGLVGVIGQASSTETSFGILSDRRYFLGAEGQYFFGNFTLYGQAAYENANFGVPGFSTITADGFVGGVQLRYFLAPNTMIAAKGGYENLRTNDSVLGGSDLHHTAWLVGGKAEHRFTATPFSVFAEADYRRADFNVVSFKEHETRAVLGMKINFGSNTLIERDRAGASLDPIRSLKAIIPAAGIGLGGPVP